MCGIAGNIFPSSTSRGASRDPSFDLPPIHRRGPDSYGVELLDCKNYRVQLVHSRLSIVDLSPLAHQPMHDSVSGWWITYNGEIYNYPEVRAELECRGWTFRSTGDTEVLLKAWAEWGIDALQRLNGMFAFAIFHPGMAQLWLVRDRFGVKPLAWGRLPQGGVAFSSSMVGIALQVGDDIDTEYCSRGLRYKVYETLISGSPFKKVGSVPAGSWVKFDLSGYELRVMEGQWYDLTTAVSETLESTIQSSDEELIDLCRELLGDAVKLRLRSDVPVAVSLSGGLDSSAVASIASKGMTQLRGFTYGSPEASLSEGPDVRKFSDAVGVDVTYVWPQFTRKTLGESLVRTMAFQEAPFSGLSLIAQNEVYRTARSADFKVLLGGQGGDELFAGYRKFFVVAMREAANRREPWNIVRLMYSFGLMLIHEAGQARLYLDNAGRYCNDGNQGFQIINWRPTTQDLWGSKALTLAGRQIEDVRQWSLPTLLRYEDRNSMGYGVESRLPFMDYRLLELALALPTRLKINNGFGKWALRKVVAGAVPDCIRMNRKKRGFDVTQEWVKEGIGDTLRQTILENRQALLPHLRADVDLDKLLTNTSLHANRRILDEALMLTWLTNPTRRIESVSMALGVS